MNALPQTAPVAISPWWRREFVVRPTYALAVAAALIVAASAVTATLIVTMR